MLVIIAWTWDHENGEDMKCGERGRKINMPLGRGEFQQVSGLNFLFKTLVASGF